MQEITVDIAPNGNPTVSVKGVKGSACKALTAEFEKGLGKKVSSKETKEFYEQQPAQVKQR